MKKATISRVRCELLAKKAWIFASLSSAPGESLSTMNAITHSTAPMAPSDVPQRSHTLNIPVPSRDVRRQRLVRRDASDRPRADASGARGDATAGERG